MATDFASLRLKAKGDRAELDRILQMECREKTRTKLGATLSAAPGFRFPSLAVAEMATSDEVAAERALMIRPGEKVLDMTFGLGIDAFAMAARAESVVSFDIVEANVTAGKENADKLGLKNVEIIAGDSVEWLKSKGDVIFDTIFVDPARRDGAGRHFRIADCSPDLTECIDLIRSRCGRVIIKLSPMLDIKAALADLGVEALEGADVKVIGYHNECKELVLVLPGKYSEWKPTGEISCITIGKPQFSFRPSQSTADSKRMGSPEVGQFLLEPYPSVMKAGGTPWLMQFKGVSQLHPNTHLFVCERVPENFPGTAFEIIDIMKFSSSNSRSFAKAYPKINVSTRNFPLRAPELAAKLRVREGGDLHLFGTTVFPSSRELIITKPIS